MTIDDFTQYLGRFFLYGGVSVGLFWVIVQKAAEKWIDSHFEKRQKEFEHEQAKELQRIKAKLDTVIQGSLKLQEREFNILPEAWEKISEAYGYACWLCSPMQSYISMDGMSDKEVDEFLSKQEDLWETQKQQIRDADKGNRSNLWREIDTRIRYNKVRNTLSAADKFLKANSLFLPDDLREQFNNQVKIIWEALTSFEIGNHFSVKDYKMINEGWKKLQEEGEPLHQLIEKAVRKRLLEQTEIVEEKIGTV